MQPNWSACCPSVEAPLANFRLVSQGGWFWVPAAERTEPLGTHRLPPASHACSLFVSLRTPGPLLLLSLPAGLDVVGFFVLCPAAAFTGAAGALAALASAASKELAGGLPSLLVLHIDSVTGALTLREAAGGSGSGSGLRPCDLKLSAVLDQMVQLQSRWAAGMGAGEVGWGWHGLHSWAGKGLAGAAQLGW